MSRAATTSDAFNAVAEPCRREILEMLAGGEAAVGDLVERLQLTQPQVSKHLGVLRTVDLVRCRSVGRRRLYRVNAPALKPIHDWVSTFERDWNERLDRLDDVLAELAAQEPAAHHASAQLSARSSAQSSAQSSARSTEPEEHP